jgi:hypothetical protein
MTECSVCGMLLELAYAPVLPVAASRSFKTRKGKKRETIECPLSASASTFPSRVKLMDKTDLVYPQFGENYWDNVAVIAMRVFTVVGNQVAEWRQAIEFGRMKAWCETARYCLNYQKFYMSILPE